MNALPCGGKGGWLSIFTRGLLVMLPAVLLAVSAVPARAGHDSPIWTGGDPDDNLFGSWQNWNPYEPNAGNWVVLTFAGSTRLIPYNNYGGWVDFKDIIFASGAGAFTIQGDAIDLFGKIENLSSSSQSISVGGLSLNSGTRQFNPLSGNLTINCAVYNNGNSLDVYGDSGYTLTLNGDLQGTGGVTLRQNSILLINTGCAYTGTTALDEGSMRFAEGGSVGGGTIYVGNGGTTTVDAELLIADANGGTTVDETVDINPGDGTIANRTVGGNNTSGVNTYSGTVSRDSDADNETVTLTAASGGIVDYTGGFAGDDTVWVTGGGVTRFSSTAKTYTGDTIITNSSTLRINAANMISDSSHIYIGSGSTLDLNGNNDQVKSIEGAGSITLGNGQLLVGGAGISKGFSGVISSTGTGTFVMKGTGTQTLSGENTFTSDTYIDSGELRLSNTADPLDSANIQLGKDSGTDSATLGIGVASGVCDNNITVRTGSSGTKYIAANNSSGDASFSGTATLNDPVTLTASSGGNLILSGNIANGGNRLTVTGVNNTTLQTGAISGTGDLLKTGAGTLTLSGNNSFSGGGYLVNGITVLNHNNALGSGTTFYVGETSGSDAVTLRIGTAGVTVTNALAVRAGSSGVMTLGNTSAGAAVFSGGVNLTNNLTLANTGGGTLALSGNMGFGGAQRQIAVNSTEIAAINGNISNDGGNGLVKKGDGTLQLGGTTSTFTGLYIDRGTADVTAEGGEGDGVIHVGTTGADTGEAAKLKLSKATGQTVAGNITVNTGAGSRAIETANTSGKALMQGSLTLNKAVTITVADGSGTDDAEISGDISSASGSLTKNGSGTLLLSGNNSYAGGTTVSAGTLKGDTDSLQGSIANTAIVEFEMAGSGTYNGSMTGAGGQLVKSGAGTLTITAANSHSGATAVNDGTLIYNGTNTSSAVTVAAAKTLMGTGSIGGTTVNGIINPGASVGGLTVSSLTLNDGSIFRCEIGNWGDTADRDRITSSGSVTFNATATVGVDDDSVSGFNNAQSKTWTIIAGGVSGTNGLALDQSTYWTPDKGGGLFSLAASGGNLLLYFTPVPQGVGAGDGTSTAHCQVTWTDGQGETGYKVFGNTVNDSNTASQVGTTLAADTTSYNDTTATPGQLYYYWVKAVTVEGDGGFSVPDSGYRALPTVAGVTASDETYSDKVKVDWTDSDAGETGYVVWRDTDSNPAGAVNLTSTALGPDVITYDDTTASPSTPYYYWVRATNNTSQSMSDWGTPDQGTRLGAGPPTVINSAASNITASGAYLGAEISTNGGATITSRGTIWDTSAVAEGSHANESGESSSATGVFSQARSGLPAESLIYHRGWASNVQGRADSPQGTFYTLSTEPSSHAGAFTATAVSTVRVDLSWTAATGADGYLIFQRQGADPTFLPADATAYSPGTTYGDSLLITNVVGLAASATGLTANTQYHFSIIPYNWNGSQTATYNYRTNATVPTANDTTFANEPTTDASGLSFSQVQEQQMLVSWTSGGGASRIVVARTNLAVNWAPVDGQGYTPDNNYSTATDQGGGNKVVFDGVGNSFTLSGLSSGTTYHVAIYEYNGSGGAQNYKTNSPHTGSKLTLIDPTGHSAPADGKEMVRPVWTPNGTYGTVMIVHRTGSAPTSPSQGTPYSVGDPCADGTVIYKGTGNTLEHVVAAGSANYYRFFTAQSDYYSSGALASVSLGSYGASEQVDTFSYSNSVALNGRNGGQGWSGAWSVGAGTWNAETNYGTTSVPLFSNVSGYPNNAGNRVKLTDPGVGNSGRVDRAFAAVSSGRIYVSCILSYQYSGPNKWAGISLMSNTTEKVFFGKVSDGTYQYALGLAGVGGTVISSPEYQIKPFTAPGSTADVWVVIGRYDFSTKVLKVKGYYRTDTIPTTEPLDGDWNATDTLSDGDLDSVNGLRLYGGSSDGGATIGAVYFDEVRIGTSWEDLLNLAAVPDPDAAAATPDGSEMADLAWTPSGGYEVMIVHKAGSASGDPTPGTPYSVGDDCGGGKVVYKGSGTSAEHEVSAGSTNYYRFFSVYLNNYSDGLTRISTNVAYYVGEIVEPLPYTNGVSLNGLNRGSGWSGAWVESNPGSYAISAGSFANIAGYPTNYANKVTVNPPGGGGERTARRSFAAVSGGKLYLSYIMNFTSDGANQYSGVSFMSNTTEKLFFGELYGRDNTDNLGADPAGADLVTSLYTLDNGFGKDYVVVGMYDFASDTAAVTGYYRTATVPVAEPTWTATGTAASAGIVSLDGVRIGAGGASSSPGACYFDEIRVGTNWLDIVGVFAPLGQATAITFNNVQARQMGVSWTRGSGAACLVIAREGAAVSGAPADFSSYDEDANYGDGDPLGGGFVVYNGTGNSFTLTGLKDSTTYHLRVFEYNGTGSDLRYNKNTATGNPNSQLTAIAEFMVIRFK